MRTRLRLIITGAVAAAMALGACGRKPEAADSEAAEAFPLPAVADSITEPERRASIVAARFWDGARILPGDTVSPALEQAMANFLAIAGMGADRDSINAGICRALQLGGEERIMGLAEHYLFDPNSPMRSEELMEAFIAQAPNWHRSAMLAELIAKNRPGSKAADFPFTDAHGRRGSLAEFARGKAELLVYFFDSECDVCKSLIPRVAEMAGSTPVLAVCPQAEADSFSQVLPLFPEEWTVVRDHGEIDSLDLYYFPALPSAYLLRGDLTVERKDFI